MKLIIDFALITGILFTSFILYSLIKKKAIYGNILVILFFLILATLFNYYGFLHRLIYIVAPTNILSDLINTISGPLFLVYIQSLYVSPKNLIRRNLIHFIVPLIDTILISIPSFLSIFIDKPSLNNYLDKLDPIAPFNISYSLIYCLISLGLLYKFRKVLKNNYSNLDNKDLKWMELFLIGAIIIICVDLSTTGYELFYGQNSWSEGYLTAVALVLLTIYLGYYGVSQSKILIPDYLFQPEVKSVTSVTAKKEPVAIIDQSEMIIIEKSLIHLMETEKPYLNEDLTLRTLASMLTISDKKLSTSLNQFMSTSFYDFINGYRVSEAKSKITDPSFEHLTLLAIGYESGFKSKTSFNRIFKNVSGFSPSEYKKKNQKPEK